MRINGGCRGVYGEGILNPNKENGVEFYQGRVREMVYAQHGLEEREVEEKHKQDAKIREVGMRSGGGVVAVV